ncbi:DUF4062 domain-containing protein [Paenibacillus sp.]|jgi:hypothetical protein|uniref:DUF4062 domain-containing protein n=1 Tax=Paenibacillus sp. TaxID=58172 RepID=UPI0035CD049E
MKKKLQVFISSTYTDMLEERQAAVTAVLNAGHIPAGMELFKSGDQSQKDTLTRWIDESDAYMLILGGRYLYLHYHYQMLCPLNPLLLKTIKIDSLQYEVI